MTLSDGKSGRKCDKCGNFLIDSLMVSVSGKLFCPDCYNSKLKEAVNGFSSNCENPVLHLELKRDTIDVFRCSQENGLEESFEPVVRIEKVCEDMDSGIKMDTALTSCLAVSCRWNEQNICRFRSVIIGEDGRCKEFEIKK